MNNSFNEISARPKSTLRKGIYISMVRFVALVFSLLTYGALLNDLIEESCGFIAYTLILLGYIYLEFQKLRVREPHLLWINPIVLSSLVTFVSAFGISNVIYFFPDEMLIFLGIKPTVTLWMNQMMLLVILGAISMWVGYDSSMGFRLSRALQRSKVLRRLISPHPRLNYLTFFACIGISFVGKIAAISMGIYGYSGGYDQAIETASYSQYFYFMDTLGSFALVSISLKCFTSPIIAPVDRLLLLIVLVYQVAFGVLSGMKSAVVMPFVILGLVYYTQRKRFSRSLITLSVIILIVAYVVIEPFRNVISEDNGQNAGNLAGIVSTLSYSSSSNNKTSSRSGSDNGDLNSIVLSIMARSNLTYIGSLGIEYAANNSPLPPDSPEFLKNIILAPLHAFIPRFLWTSKPLEVNGQWYTNQVVGSDNYSSTAMSPITFLNFAGGPLAVILGFLLVGIFHRGFFDGLRHFGAGGLIVFLGLLGGLVNIDNSFNNFLINIFRFFPILIFVQYFLFRRSHIEYV